MCSPSARYHIFLLIGIFLVNFQAWSVSSSTLPQFSQGSSPNNRLFGPILPNPNNNNNNNLETLETAQTLLYTDPPVHGPISSGTWIGYPPLSTATDHNDEAGPFGIHGGNGVVGDHHHQGHGHSGYQNYNYYRPQQGYPYHHPPSNYYYSSYPQQQQQQWSTGSGYQVHGGVPRGGGYSRRSGYEAQ